MKTTETLPSVVRSFPAPKGYTGKIVVTAKAEHLSGNAHPYFSVTAAIGTDRQLQTGDWQAGGCMHEEIAKAWPAIQPIIDLHLANSDDGEPMHAEANGFYQLAGSVEGNLGEQYHAGNIERHFPCAPPADKSWKNAEYRLPTHEECIASTAEYLRISEDDVRAIRAEVIAAFRAGADSVASSEDVSAIAQKERTKAGNIAAKAKWAEFIDTLRPQWKAQAEVGIALLERLANN